MAPGPQRLPAHGHGLIAIVLKGYGVGPDGIGWFIMAVPVAYILGNFMTSRLITQAGESRVMNRV